MRYSPRSLTVGLCVLSLLGAGLTLASTTGASAAGALPSSINEVLSVNGTLTDPGCPSFAGVSPAPTPYSNLATAVAAATAGQTLYVCLGNFDLTSSPQIVISQPLTIDGYNWNVQSTASDTSASVDSFTQSVFANFQGFLVQSGDVNINGLTFSEGDNAIEVRTLVSGPGDQGESNVSITDNFFTNVGGGNGDIHFGLGQDGDDTQVTTLDGGDVVQDNVFAIDPGFENNPVQMSDTIGAQIVGNVVNYPIDNSSGSDDLALSGLWLPGYDQATVIEDNQLNGGGVDSDSSGGAAPDTADPKSGIKIIDNDANGPYGIGCGSQIIEDNTISGFVYGISLISTGYDGGYPLCPVGPSDFTVTDNTVSNSRLYGIYLSGATGGTVSNNNVSTTDTETYPTLGYTSGEYDFYDAAGLATTNMWVSNSGTGSAYPSSITTTTTSPPPPPPATTSTTSTTTTSTTTSTTTTTVPPRPSVRVLTGATLSGKDVVTTVICSGARCAGTLNLTKSVSLKVEIGKTKTSRVRTTLVELGKANYAVAAGTRREVSIALSTAGLKLVRSAKSGAFSCSLTISGGGGLKHETISFKAP